MKKVFYFSVVLLISTIFQNCKTISIATDTGSKLKLAKHQLILKTELSNNEIHLLLRTFFDEEFTIRSCSCGDNKLKLLDFNGTLEYLDLYTAVTGLGNPRGGGVNSDFQFIAKLPRTFRSKIKFHRRNRQNISDFLADDTTKVVLAILDSGIDLNYFPNKRFLYRNPSDVNCSENSAASGWNFVNGNDDIRDNFRKIGHGTMVTRAVTNTLDSKDTGYQILPLKVANKRGKLTYFDILCAMSFIEKIQESTNGKIKVINSSFGVQNKGFFEMTLWQEYVEHLRTKSVIVASAGNDGINTDESWHARHVPSGFTHDNILAVGGYKSLGSKKEIHEESNYGTTSIDIATPYIISIDNNKARGTSFGAAYVSALMAEKFEKSQTPNPLPADLIIDFINNNPNTPDLRTYIRDGKFVE